MDGTAVAARPQACGCVFFLTEAARRGLEVGVFAPEVEAPSRFMLVSMCRCGSRWGIGDPDPLAVVLSRVRAAAVAGRR